MSDRTLLPVRVASGSSIKLNAVKGALKQALWDHQLEACPTELQNLDAFNAQPEGREQTEAYACARYRAMCDQYGQNPDGLDVVIESGAIDGQDLAIVLLVFRGSTYVNVSQPVPFPEGALEAARERGFETTTAGDIIHEWSKGTVPANDWHPTVMPGMTRERQIAEALVPLLRGIVE